MSILDLSQYRVDLSGINAHMEVEQIADGLYAKSIGNAIDIAVMRASRTHKQIIVKNAWEVEIVEA